MQQSEDAFLTARTQILKQKYQYMKMYQAQTSANLARLKNQNQQLRKAIVSQQNEQCQKQWKEIQADCRRQQKQKMNSLMELNKLIEQYKFLCQEAIRRNQPAIGASLNQSTSELCKSKQSFRENSRISILERSQNCNTSNRSGNRSYRKVKTHIGCEGCGREYQPNEYYQHLQQCRKQQKSVRLDGYHSLRQ